MLGTVTCDLGDLESKSPSLVGGDRGAMQVIGIHSLQLPLRSWAILWTLVSAASVANQGPKPRLGSTRLTHMRPQ